MALKITTTIHNMQDVSIDDFCNDEEYYALLACEHSGAEVVIECETTDGYYDIALPNGREIPAVSWYHLDGFTEDGISL